MMAHDVGSKAACAMILLIAAGFAGLNLKTAEHRWGQVEFVVE